MHRWLSSLSCLRAQRRKAGVAVIKNYLVRTKVPTALELDSLNEPAPLHNDVQTTPTFL